MSFDESKNGTNTNSVKFFSHSQLSKPTVDDSWDRIKIICTQPFNKHVQYGLSFIIVHTKAAEVSEDDKLPNLGKFTWKQTENDDGFSAGSLFTKKKLDGGPLIGIFFLLSAYFPYEIRFLFSSSLYQFVTSTTCSPRITKVIHAKKL